MITGVVQTTKTSGYVAALVNGQRINVECERDLTPAVGDVIVIAQIGSKYIALGRTSAAAPGSAEGNEAPPPTSPQTGVLTVTPVETRSYRPAYGWRFDTDDVYQGEYGGWGNHTGCAFYGSKPRALDGATVTDASLRMRCLQIGSYPPSAATMRLITNTVRPGGAPTLTSSATGPALVQGAETQWDVPTAWAQAIVDGTAGGIGAYIAGGTPYIRWAGRGAWSAAFTLTIRWRR